MADRGRCRCASLCVNAEESRGVLRGKRASVRTPGVRCTLCAKYYCSVLCLITPENLNKPVAACTVIEGHALEPYPLPAHDVAALVDPLPLPHPPPDPIPNPPPLPGPQPPQVPDVPPPPHGPGPWENNEGALEDMWDELPLDLLDWAENLLDMGLEQPDMQHGGGDGAAAMPIVGQQFLLPPAAGGLFVVFDGQQLDSQQQVAWAAVIQNMFDAANVAAQVHVGSLIIRIQGPPPSEMAPSDRQRLHDVLLSVAAQCPGEDLVLHAGGSQIWRSVDGRLVEDASPQPPPVVRHIAAVTLSNGGRVLVVEGQHLLGGDLPPTMYCIVAGSPIAEKLQLLPSSHQGIEVGAQAVGGELTDGGQEAGQAATTAQHASKHADAAGEVTGAQAEDDMQQRLRMLDIKNDPDTPQGRRSRPQGRSKSGSRRDRSGGSRRSCSAGSRSSRCSSHSRGSSVGSRGSRRSSRGSGRRRSGSAPGSGVRPQGATARAGFTTTWVERRRRQAPSSEARQQQAALQMRRNSRQPGEVQRAVFVVPARLQGETVTLRLRRGRLFAPDIAVKTALLANPPMLQARTSAAGSVTNPLITAAKAGDAEAMSLALAIWPSAATTIDASGYTPLHYACQGGHAGIVSQLLAAGADVNVAARPPMADDDATAADELDFDGDTPLLLAAEFGHTEIAGQLLEAGADVDACDEDGHTAVLLAAEGGHDALLHLLVAAGAVLS